jgi:hypothetical protein
MVGGAVALVAAGARFATFDPYERTQTTAKTLRSGFHLAVAGAPLAALLLAFASGIAIVVLRRVHALPRRAPLFVVGPLVVAVAVLGWWAADVTRWQNASAYRGWVGAASIPFFALAVIDAWLPTPVDRAPATSAALRGSLGAASVACALVFAVTSTLQGIGWHGLTRDFERKVAGARTVCIPRAAVLPARRGPLSHWASNSLAIVLQSRDPKHIVLDTRKACSAFEQGAVPAVVGHGRILKPPKGWVRLPQPH